MVDNRRARSVKSMYEECFGLGTYSGVPVEGGLAELEKRFKSRWRRNFTAADQKHFSRIQQVVMAVRKEVAAGKGKEEVIVGYEQVFAEVKNSLCGLVDRLQETGAIEKKRRRGRRMSPVVGGGGGSSI